MLFVLRENEGKGKGMEENGAHVSYASRAWLLGAWRQDAAVRRISIKSKSKLEISPLNELRYP